MYSYKILWDYNKKEESDSCINDQQTSFCMLDLKEKHFLDLVNYNFESIIFIYIKDGS